jgi:hypothetical protein
MQTAKQFISLFLFLMCGVITGLCLQQGVLLAPVDHASAQHMDLVMVGWAIAAALFWQAT